jgi:cell division protein FtsQ
LFVTSTTDRGFSSIAETLSALPSTIRSKVLSISAQSRDSVTFTLRNSGHVVVWGSPDNSPLKVLVMDRALRVADRSGGAYEIDVSAPDNIVLQKIS